MDNYRTSVWHLLCKRDIVPVTEGHSKGICHLLTVISLIFAIIANDVMGCLCSQCTGTRNMRLLGYTKGAF